MTPSLRALERQLQRTAASGGTPSPRILEAMQAAADKEVESIRAEAAEEVKEAKTEVTRLRADLADLHTQMQKMQEKHANEMKAAFEASQRMQTTMHGKHMDECERMSNEIMSLHDQLTGERTERARLEGEAETLRKANTVLQKLADHPPFVINPPSPAAPLPSKPTRGYNVTFNRDYEGRLLSATLNPKE